MPRIPTTFTLTVNAAGADETVVAQTNCSSIEFMEDPSVAGWPTVDWIWRAPTAGSPAVRQPAGTSYIWNAPAGGYFDVGQVVAYVSTATGSSTFRQVEQ